MRRTLTGAHAFVYARCTLTPSTPCWRLRVSPTRDFLSAAMAKKGTVVLLQAEEVLVG